MTKNLETLAEDIYRRVGLQPDEPASVANLAELLAGGVYESPEAPYGGALWHGGVVIQPGLSKRRESRAIALLIARGTLRNAGERPAEESVEYLAACLRAPRPAVLRFIAARGFDPALMATAFCITQSCAFLRYGEVSGNRVVLLAPGKPVRIRGSGSSRRLFHAALSDAPGRLALFAVA